MGAPSKDLVLEVIKSLWENAKKQSLNIGTNEVLTIDYRKCDHVKTEDEIFNEQCYECGGVCKKGFTYTPITEVCLVSFIKSFAMNSRILTNI